MGVEEGVPNLFRSQPYGCYATAEKANHASSIAGAPQSDETGASRLLMLPSWWTIQSPGARRLAVTLARRVHRQRRGRAG